MSEGMGGERIWREQVSNSRERSKAVTEFEHLSQICVLQLAEASRVNIW